MVDIDFKFNHFIKCALSLVIFIVGFRLSKKQESNLKESNMRLLAAASA